MQRLIIRSVLVICSGLLASPMVMAEDHAVIQKDKKFDQTSIDVKVGDTITFKNQEKDVTHNVFSLGPTNAFELKSQKPGESSTVAFKAPGQVDVECAIHTGMKLKVNVK